jgi:membrane protease YdiL (CAAX protease family)
LSAGDGWRALLLAFVAWVALPALIPPSPSRWILATLLIEGAFAAIAILHLRRGGFRSGAPGALPWTVLGTAGLTLLLLGFAALLLKLFPESRPQVERLEADLRGLRPELAWSMVVILVPLGEELLFRGAALRAFRASYGAAAAVALTGLLFAVIHVEPPRILVTFALGLWFGALAVRTNGLAAPVAAHAANNALVLALARGEVETIPWPAAAAGGAAFAASAIVLFARRGSVQGSGRAGTS